MLTLRAVDCYACGGLAEHVADGGALVIVTGNAADLTDRSQYPDALDLPDHLNFTGARALEALMNTLGFRLRTLHALRLDTPKRMLRNVKNRLKGRPAPLSLPYTSQFRSLWGLFVRERR